jgi:hypothetical protein
MEAGSFKVQVSRVQVPRLETENLKLKTCRYWTLGFTLGAALLFLSGAKIWATEAVPLEFRQTDILFNFQSQRGVPISTVSNVPPGSDGRMTIINESGSALLPTTNQFRGLTTFGATPGRVRAAWLAASNSPALRFGTSAFTGQLAQQMGLPVALSNTTVALVMRRAVVGTPYLSRQVSFSFGAEIPVPLTDENGLTLTNIASQAYWLPEPHSTNNHSNAGYYWSVNSRKVYAIQPGPISITWIKAAYTTVPPGGTYITNGGNYFRTYKADYIVSGSPVKPSRKIYWTEKGFRQLGKPVAIPSARVGDLTIVYNNNFPRTVTSAYTGPGDSSPTDGTTNTPLPELRTLWYDRAQNSLFAYNQEGRVFLELLGDSRSDGQSREQLGFEIVDVFKQPTPLDVTTELGERLLPPSPGTVEALSPEPVQQGATTPFAYHQNVPGGDELRLYAIRETQNVNDYLVHWMEEGEVGLKWPALMGRYKMVWPNDPAKYSHYLRPLVANENEAKLTAVPMPRENVPTIQYQDPLDRPRAKLTETFALYTWLEAPNPAHRTLLLFNSGDNIAFERVFSWLDTTLKGANFAGTVATNLMSWNPTNQTMTWPNELRAPRVVNQTVAVGKRITAPGGELGSGTGTSYYSGHIRTEVGTHYNIHAYVDPFSAGFETANLGSIVPVNAVPGTNRLEVWWFRSNNADTALGFKTIYWPSTIGRYTVQWPTDAGEIVLASNKGNNGVAPLNSFEASGFIYYQNDPTQHGYNPNEEHAIISGGTVYATRDDLNITNGPAYSSERFVLLEYADQDGRPSMSAFKVLREKPQAGWVFDYITEAGSKLQAPMPLPLLAKPVEGAGANAINYNTEPDAVAGDLPGAWNENRDASGPFGHYKRFTYRDRKNDFWVYRGPHAGLPALRAGTYNPISRTFSGLTSATAVAGQSFEFVVHASRQDEFLAMSGTTLPAWLSISGLALRGAPPAGSPGTVNIQLIVRDLYQGDSVTNTLAINVAASGTVVSQGPLVLLSTNSYTGSVIAFSNRPPLLAASPVPTNSFTMRFYYKAEPSFAWPGIASPPPPGSIVPYLRPLTGGTYAGDPTSKATPALDIVYRPVWPERDPRNSARPVATMPYGFTLTRSDLELPGVRDFKTARVLYQQSIAAHITNAEPSVVLHDPTREKSAGLTNSGLTQIPPSVRTELYLGKHYFPNLPPHLASRVFFDANRGAKGSLVLKGEFKDQDYLLLNVLRGSDLDAVKALCPSSDTDNYPKWTNLVGALATSLETFHENPAVPGAYEPNTSLTVSVGVSDLPEIDDDNIPVDSYALSASGPGDGYVTLIESGGAAFTRSSDPVTLHVFRVVPELYVGELKVLAAANPLSEQVTFQHSLDLAGRFDEYFYEWKIAAPIGGQPPAQDANMSQYLSLTSGTNLPRYLLGGSGIQVLGDNYVVLRYKPANTNHPLYNQWSDWTTPQLAEGWIKRVLAGINPFNQRITDLFNNRVNTDASILTQAGHRWEGDVALNLETINNFGLIEIYETVLRRGRSISIESGYNYGPANDALLLAAGYLNDLYMMLGNESWADAANPTIGIGTADRNYGEIATALFAFKGQTASLLEEELTLIRGRDDFLVPGVQSGPVYNRLFWNYTRGIDAGEVIYAINYNIQENPNLTPDGLINAEDAKYMFPQGHGDAYGHYLTALKGYFSLLMNENFDWVPRSEAVLVLGEPISVDYQDERKFAAAAAALARAGRQAFDLTWRQDYKSPQKEGWNHFGATRVNSQRQYSDGGTNYSSVRYWGLDHWSTRVGQGSYLNWVVGNAIIPDEDPNPLHEGIQKIDRSTVPELQELATAGGELQHAMENAEGGLTPLGLSENSIAFDLNPLSVANTEKSHFDQIYQRAIVALNNAVASFDDAKNVTSIMRSEQDSLADFQNDVAQQELAFENALIELYGTPYTDDIGPGKTWKQGYAGPDLVHYNYVDRPEQPFPSVWNYPGTNNVYKIDIQDFRSDWLTNYNLTDLQILDSTDPRYSNGVHYIEINIGPDGFAQKPASWTGGRASPGQIQQAISEVIAAHTALRQALFDQSGTKTDLDRTIALFKQRMADHSSISNYQRNLLIAEQTLESVQFADEIVNQVFDSITKDIERLIGPAKEALPTSLIVGVASGGDLTSAGRAAIEAGGFVVKKGFEVRKFVQFAIVKALELATSTAQRWTEFEKIAPIEWQTELRSEVAELGDQWEKVMAGLSTINERYREYDDAVRAYSALTAQGDRIQQERLVFRQRASAVVQGFRTRDAAFRIFRNEKLERYKTLFDLAARYTFLAANAYDYETGLLDTPTGRAFRSRIVGARALGVVQDGEPQYAGSATGDPGLSSALAEMKADWEVLRGRLSFHNPDAYGTTVSLRTENFRILPGTNSDPNWKDLLLQHRVPDLLADADVRRHCMQISRGSGLPVPGIVLEFGTTILPGRNVFGKQLAAGDHTFSASSFATKLFAVGVALEGYRGMDDPAANAGDSGSSPADPDTSFLDPEGLAATPYVYLIPVGLDFMRSPPLGDASGIRSWSVEDVAIPLPFNIGASALSTSQAFNSSDFLTEPFFAVRKHQAFRPVSSATLFGTLVIYWTGGELERSQYTNTRLLGRSVWNNQWKLVIPGHVLLNDPDEGLNRFINTVHDIKLFFHSYSYSGN